MWLVWRPGSPDPSRPSPAIHFDDPAKDRKDGAKEERLCQPIPIAPEHRELFARRELSLRELVRIDTYKAPPIRVTADA